MGITALLPLLIFGVGGYLLVSLRAFFIFHPIRTLREIHAPLKQREARNSLMLALAGTLGVGNIFGVAAGIMIGGAGSVFWLLVSSFFAMIIKYAEALLAFDNLDEQSSGMHAVICRVFRKHGRSLSKIYALLCAFLALLMGAAMQSTALAGVAAEAFAVNPLVSGILFSLLALVGCVGGVGKIEKITAFAIPLTTVVYIIMSFSVVLIEIHRLPTVICDVVYCAFAPSSAVGGIFAFLFSRALFEGFARGILSNEAGTGTSSLAHIRAKDRTPHEAGLFGMCEVFFDTTLLCTLTALAILLSVENPSAYKTPMSLVSAAFSSSLGEWSVWLLLGCILLFAYSTVICWYYYGTECASYLFMGKGRVLFSLLFFLFIALGASMDNSFLIYLTDLIIFFMSLLTLSAILHERRRIKKLFLSSRK